MATARELLEQADALMRRNRLRGEPAVGAVLMGEVPGAPHTAPANEADRGGPRPDDDDDFPVLTDAVTDREPISLLGPDEDGDPSRWPTSVIKDAPTDDWSAMGPATTTRAPEPEAAPAPEPPSAPLAVGEQRTVESPAPPAEAAAEVLLLTDEPPVAPVEGADEAAPLGVDLANEIDVMAARLMGGEDDDLRWASLAEEVRMQVLQRLDIFTDTGLQEQLAARLQPIVDSASADLVTAINQHLGALLRSYVAEAIEREIEKLRREVP